MTRDVCVIDVQTVETYTREELPTCPITSSVYFSQIKLNCNHGFEAAAISAWQKQYGDSATCPCCQKPITGSESISDPLYPLN